jgi:hypothetical protein
MPIMFTVKPSAISYKAVGFGKLVLINNRPN